MKWSRSFVFFICFIYHGFSIYLKLWINGLKRKQSKRIILYFLTDTQFKHYWNRKLLSYITKTEIHDEINRRVPLSLFPMSCSCSLSVLCLLLRCLFTWGSYHIFLAQKKLKYCLFMDKPWNGNLEYIILIVFITCDVRRLFGGGGDFIKKWWKWGGGLGFCMNHLFFLLYVMGFGRKGFVFKHI